MPRYRYFLWIPSLAFIGFLTLSCGAQRQAVSVTINPASAVAQNGQAQFIATGTYNTSPNTVTPLQANWAVTVKNGGPTTDVSIGANGLARCVSAASGVYTVGAWVVKFSTPPSAMCLTISPFGEPCGDSVIGFAELTCP